MQTAAAHVQESQIYHDNDGFPELLASVTARFRVADGPLFLADAPGLYDTFLVELPTRYRQHYTCRSCRNFVERFGSLVTIAEDGRMVSALWDPASTPERFKCPVASMALRVEQSEIEAVFLTSENVLGVPVSPVDKLGRVWTHLAVASKGTYRHPIKTADQAVAELREDRSILARSLGEYPEDIATKAHQFLSSGQLFRSEKCEAIAAWFVGVHRQTSAVKNQRLRKNLIWKAAATAPAGFCHIRSSMIGTLLDDIMAGQSFEIIKARFDAKMNPLQYQRPQAPPSEGNIAQAEKIIERLGGANALARRYARLEEIETIWRPAARVEAPAGGVFAHLKRQPPAAVTDLGAQTMTWDKFQRTVLPSAEKIELLAPGHGHYSALVTAADSAAPPILQWDREDKRNPVSWYVYNGGSSAHVWNLSGGTFVAVTGVAFQPSMWGEPLENHGKAVFFLLADCKDRNGAGLCLFPEILKGAFREIRSTIEAHSASQRMQGKDEATACGIRLQAGMSWDAQVRVTSNGTRTIYKLDRWD